jgi:hypothetical protein
MALTDTIIMWLLLLFISVPFIYGAHKLYLKQRNPNPHIEFGQHIQPLSSLTPEMLLSGQYADRKYMPFRYPQAQTMALCKLDMNHWGMMDKEYIYFMNEKRRLFDGYDSKKLASNKLYKRMGRGRDRGEDDDRTGKHYDEVFVEFADFVVNHYTTRFPQLFVKRGRIIHNVLMDEHYDLDKMDPFLVATRIAMEDFYVITKDEVMDEQKCIGVSVAFGGGGFPITPIVGEGIHKIHAKVPYYESKLKFSMSKWFDRFVDPVERSSWHIVWDKNLNCSDFYDKYRQFADVGSPEKFHEYVSTIPFEKFEVRIERQTLIKLPHTGAIVFSNHPLFLNIERELLDVPSVPAIIQRILHDAPEDVIKYKHYDLLRDHLDPMLTKAVARQIHLGMYDPQVRLQTLPGYPFFVTSDKACVV